MAKAIGSIQKWVLSSALAFLALGLLSPVGAVSSGVQSNNAPAVGSKPKASDLNSMCIGCHGIPGYKSSFPGVYSVPFISGQNAKYLESALNAYKKGDRNHPTMRGIADSLSDTDIATLAEFYSKPKAGTKPMSQPRLSSAAAAGKTLADAQCAVCHAKDGNWNLPMDVSYPKLAGQHRDYLVHSLREYQTGARNNAIMAGIAKGLSKQDIRNLSAYFAALDGDLYLKK